MKDEWQFVNEKLYGIMAQLVAQREHYDICLEHIKHMIVVLVELYEMMRHCHAEMALTFHLGYLGYSKDVRADLSDELTDRICDTLWRLSTVLLEMLLDVRKLENLNEAKQASLNGAELYNVIQQTRFSHRVAKKLLSRLDRELTPEEIAMEEAKEAAEMALRARRGRRGNLTAEAIAAVAEAAEAAAEAEAAIAASAVAAEAAEEAEGWTLAEGGDAAWAIAELEAMVEEHVEAAAVEAAEAAKVVEVAAEDNAKRGDAGSVGGAGASSGAEKILEEAVAKAVAKAAETKTAADAAAEAAVVAVSMANQAAVEAADVSAKAQVAAEVGAVATWLQEALDEHEAARVAGICAAKEAEREELRFRAAKAEADLEAIARAEEETRVASQEAEAREAEALEAEKARRVEVAWLEAEREAKKREAKLKAANRVAKSAMAAVKKEAAAEARAREMTREADFNASLPKVTCRSQAVESDCRSVARMRARMQGNHWRGTT